MKSLALFLASLLSFSPFPAQAAIPSWQDADIGSPGTTGGHKEAQGELIVTGAGKDTSRSDQLHFTYKTIPAGDVEIIARLTSLEGEKTKASAGLMLRKDNDPASAKALTGFMISKDGANLTFYNYRDPDAAMKGSGGGSRTTMQLPLWLRFTRVGKDFAVARSQDGKTWVQLSNGSGGAFTPDGPIEVGLFAASGDPVATAMAKFDHITIGKPKLAFHSGWIGNTYGQYSTGHVSGTIGALWVAPDGSCYTNSYWDEAGQAAKIYKDGKVVAGINGNNACGEGSITSDGTRVYRVAGPRLFDTDMLETSPSTRPVTFASSIWDERKKPDVQSAIVGLAAVNDEIFVSDSVSQKIRVAGSPDKTKLYFIAGNSTDTHTNEAIDTTGVTNAAPAELYQSQRDCDYLPYQIPDLTPKTEYTVRFHLADYKYDKPGQRIMALSAGGQQTVCDIAATARAKNKAVVADLPHAVTDANGAMALSFTHAPGSTDGHAVICGFEILNPDGTRAFALNCGGGPIDGFQSEVNEIPERAFAFPRPGPMTADKRGDLWIIQHPSAPSTENPAAIAVPAAIKCYHTDGTFTNKQITDVVNPTALAYDSTKDQLLVAEGGPDQNIRFYENLASSPNYAKSFGIKGGIYAGKHPGLLSDPVAGGDARFYGLNGIGIDAHGNIYTSCSSSGTDLRKFTPDGKLVWMLNGLHFVDCASVDPDSDGKEVYCPWKHYTMDYSKTAPGSEWKYVSYNWDPSKYGPQQRGNVSSAIMRRVGSKRALLMYTSGQGEVGYAGIYRFDGEIAAPAAKFSPNKKGGVDVWIDKNGDGLETPDEVTTCPIGLGSYSVDQKGDIWIAGCTGALLPQIHHFFFHGLNEFGVPLYGTTPSDYEIIPFPYQQGSVWGNTERVYYDSDRDVLYLLGPVKSRKSDKEDPLNYLARYDNWSKGNRKERWMINLPDPYTDSNFMHTPPLPYGLAFGWIALDVAVDKIFVVEMWGPIHVFDAATGNADTILIPGPEVSGSNAWEDEQMGIQAFKRKNGEYVVFTENNGFGAKNNMFRWKPQSSSGRSPKAK